MPEVATDETLTKRRQKRAEAAGVEPEDIAVEETAIAETALRSQVARPQAPIVRVKAVYLRAHPYRSVTLPGRIMSETVYVNGVAKLSKKLAQSGNTPYDFTLRDQAGELIAIRIMPSNHPVAEVRGKRFEWVEHPDHAYALVNMKVDGQPEFQLVGAPADMAILEEYFVRVNRAKREQKRDYQELGGVVR